MDRIGLQKKQVGFNQIYLYLHRPVAFFNKFLFRSCFCCCLLVFCHGYGRLNSYKHCTKARKNDTAVLFGVLNQNFIRFNHT
jgi:hypothetical protein